MTTLTYHQNIATPQAIYATQFKYSIYDTSTKQTTNKAETSMPNGDSETNFNMQADANDIIDGIYNDMVDIMQPDIDKAVSLALNYDCVIGARAFNYKDKIVVALLTMPFYLKSERDGTRWRIQNELSDGLCYDDIIVTFDVEVYRKIKSELSDEQMRYLLTLAQAR